ncbi:MAG: SprT family zinc-dependent metalloprotease [Clostridia bacterium]
MKELKIIYSNRKSISLSVTRDLEIIVRAPKRASRKYIEDFVLSHTEWIQKQYAQISIANEHRVVLTDEDIAHIKVEGKIYISERVAYFEQIMGVKSTGLKITSAVTRWGSCSYKNSLCFSYKTMLLPKDLIDYVVVHELAHILEKNHSSNFYVIVEKYIPNYKNRIAMIKELGRSI